MGAQTLFKFIAARCSIKKLSTQHLHFKLKKHMSAVIFHEFIVSVISFGGAPKDRSLLRKHEKISVSNIVKHKVLLDNFLNYGIDSFKVILLHLKLNNIDVFI